MALENHVEILIPKLRLLDPWKDKPEESRWDRVKLRVNLFSDEESPLVAHLPFRSFSVGEEQSESQVVALAWSPPGLARNKRSALAVLTENHVLSIWDSSSYRKDPKSWVRVLVVNQSLRQAFGLPKSSDEVEVTQAEEFSRLGCRIRSFSWGPVFYDVCSSNKASPSFSLQSHGYYCLAVTNDLGQIILTRIHPGKWYQHSMIEVWSASVLTHRDIFGLPVDPQQLSTPSTTPIGSSSLVSDICWSPPVLAQEHGKDQVISILAYLVDTRLNLLLCRASFTPVDLVVDLVQEKSDFKEEFLGPLAWSQSAKTSLPASSTRSFVDQRVTQLQYVSLYLLVFTSQHVHTITLESETSHLQDLKATMSMESCDNVWSKVAGFFFDEGVFSKSPSLQVVSDTATGDETCGKAYSWPVDNSKATWLPPWIRIIRHIRKSFDEDNGLDGHVLSRIYGLDVSPFGDKVVVALSLHPSQLIEYVIANDQVTYLGFDSSFNRQKMLDDLRALLDRPSIEHGKELADQASQFHYSTEAVLLSLKEIISDNSNNELLTQGLLELISSSKDTGVYSTPTAVAE